MKTVNALVGLAEDASEGALESEITKLLETTGCLKQRLTELEKAHASLLVAQVDSDIELYKNRILTSERAKWKEALIENRLGMMELLATLPVILKESERIENSSEDKHFEVQKTSEIDDTPQNRSLARTAREAVANLKWQEPQNTPENRALAKKIASRAEQFRRNVSNLTYEDSWVMAGKELGLEDIY